MNKNLKAFGSMINIPQILIGLSVLLLGTLVYVVRNSAFLIFARLSRSPAKQDFRCAPTNCGECARFFSSSIGNLGIIDHYSHLIS